MVKFTVSKDNVEAATALLNTVSGLKSLGAIPAESSGITLSLNSMMLYNMNEANGVTISDIPITVVEGTVTDHLDYTYMVNTKKLDSVVKGSGKEIPVTILEDKVVIGEGKRSFDLAMFRLSRKELPEIKTGSKAIQLEPVLKKMSETNLITENSGSRADLAGTLFSGKAMMASDKSCALFINDNGLGFTDASENALDMDEELLITTDLFAACASKIKTKEAITGTTISDHRFVMVCGNTTLYKSTRTEKFPKDKLLGWLQAVDKDYVGGNNNIITAKVSTTELAEKLRELRSIVEQDDYILEYNRSGSIILKSLNTHGKASGLEQVDAEITMPEGTTYETASAKFSFQHMDILCQLFVDVPTILLVSAMESNPQKPVIKRFATKTDAKCYFFIPKS